MHDILTACTNVCENIYKGYDRTQNDYVNPYTLLFSCQKQMAAN